MTLLLFVNFVVTYESLAPAIARKPTANPGAAKLSLRRSSLFLVFSLYGTSKAPIVLFLPAFLPAIMGTPGHSPAPHFVVIVNARVENTWARHSLIHRNPLHLFSQTHLGVRCSVYGVAGSVALPPSVTESSPPCEGVRAIAKSDSISTTV